MLRLAPLLFALVTACEAASTTQTVCPVGAEGCACTPNGFCGAGLACVDRLCLTAGPDGDETEGPDNPPADLDESPAVDTIDPLLDSGDDARDDDAPDDDGDDAESDTAPDDDETLDGSDIEGDAGDDAGETEAEEDTCVCETPGPCCDGCNAVNAGAACDDGQYCSIASVCTPTGVCEGVGARDCNRAVTVPECQAARCNEALDRCDAVIANDGQPCDDGNPLTETSTCDAGVCRAACTCGPGVSLCCNGCLPRNVGTRCDDGRFCTDGERCDARGLCTPAADRDCGFVVSSAACGRAACDEGADRCALIVENEGGPCDDGDTRTYDDTCRAGVCVGKACECGPGESSCCDGCRPRNVFAPCGGADYCRVGARCTSLGVCGDSEPRDCSFAAGGNDCRGVRCSEFQDRCDSFPVSNGTACNGGAGTCNNGTCNTPADNDTVDTDTADPDETDPDADGAGDDDPGDTSDNAADDDAAGDIDDEPAAYDPGLVWVAARTPGRQLTRSEVTVRQWSACVAAGRCTALPERTPQGGRCNGARPGFEDDPANCVTQAQAEGFCAAAGAALPTRTALSNEAAGGGGLYPWGAAAPDCNRAHIADNRGYGCGTDTTAGVCTKPAGNHPETTACDLVGNVWEWAALDVGGASYTCGGGIDADAAVIANFAAAGCRPTPATRVDRAVGFRCMRAAP